MTDRDILLATAERYGEIVLPDGHTITRGRMQDQTMPEQWLIYTPDSREIHFARDGKAAVVHYPTLQAALCEYDCMTRERSTAAEKLERVVAYLQRWVSRWDRAEQRDTGDVTDEQVKAAMSGHAMWDDPPEDWTEQELLIWSRGYLWAESTHLGTAAAVLSFAIDAHFGLQQICEELRK